MRLPTLVAVAAWTCLGLHSQACAQTVNLRTAGSFAVLAGAEVTSTGPTVLYGDLGVSPGASITGFPPGIVNGTIHAADGVALQAKADLVTAYNDAAGRSPTADLTGQDLGGLTLLPGVYSFSSSAQLTGGLTLNALGNPDSVFIFQIGSTLTTASSSSVRFINGGDGCNVFWQVGSSATLGTDTFFNGHILALSSITMNTGADIVDGSALARNGTVTLDENVIDVRGCLTGTPPGDAVPEPASILMFSAGLGALATLRRRRHVCGDEELP